nr:helix-turn-helix transcriptional regulator [Bacteroides caecimuris]
MAVKSGEDNDMSLTIQERIKDLRVEHGLTLKELAEQTGLSSSALGSYEADDTKDISHYALIKLAKFYGVTADYLLGLTETKRHPNADLADLRLSDAMIEVLKERRVDTALLGELVAHPDFVKLLADIQIYVEGIAATQIQNLNAWVDVARAEIVEKYQPGENDRTTYLLQAAHVDEGEYFTSRVHRDIDAIMEDIREAHRGRSDSAPENSAAEKLKQDLEEVARFNGSKLEQLIMLFCKQTKLRYNKLTEKEKQWLVRIAQKSELLKSSVSQRGKKRK